MTTLVPPAPDAPAEEWGRIAVSLPGWRWMPGMREGRTGERYEEGDGPWVVNKWPDPDDPATAGCLLALLSPECFLVMTDMVVDEQAWVWWDGEWNDAPSLGCACIAAAASLGRWPGGGE